MKDFNKPNLNGSRYRKKIPSLVSTKNDSFFKSFIKKHPEHSDLDIKVFKKIINYHCKQLASHISKTRDGIELGHQIGIIFLGGMKHKFTIDVINYAKSLEYGKVIKGGNLNQDGLIAKIYMSLQHARYKMKSRELWGFKACRELSRSCSKNFRENWEQYIVIDHLKSIHDVFNKNNRIVKMKAKEEIDKKYFNDFDI